MDNVVQEETTVTIVDQIDREVASFFQAHNLYALKRRKVDGRAARKHAKKLILFLRIYNKLSLVEGGYKGRGINYKMGLDGFVQS